MLEKALPELVRAVEASSRNLLLAAGTALVVVLVLAYAECRAPLTLSRAVFWVALAAAVFSGVYLAWQRLWLGDDAFISFRYALNLAEGRGPVFNDGEFVEGYTNFLWVILLAGARQVGLDIPATALFGNLACLGGVIVLTALLVRRLAPYRPVLPVAALVLGGSIAFDTYGSSGLETMPGTLLLMGGVLAIFYERVALSSLLLVLAALMRPDFLIFWGCMALTLVFEGYRSYRAGVSPHLSRYVKFVVPLLLVFGPFVIFRYAVYGDLVPNTYYVKSGGSAYYSQGLVFLAVFLAGTGAWLWLPASLMSAFGKSATLAEFRFRVFAFLALVMFGHYVVRVGGDFMENRFFVPLWPIALALLELNLRWVLARGKAVKRIAFGVVSAAAFGAALVPIVLFKPFEKKWGIAAEYTFYRVESIRPLVVNSRYFREGKRLAQLFKGDSSWGRLGQDCVGMVGYYSRLNIIDALGLTNRRVAHKPIKRRGRPGHEKKADLGDLLAEGATLSHRNYWGKEWEKFSKIRAGKGLNLHWVQRTPEAALRLTGMKDVKLPPVPGKREIENAQTSLLRSRAVSAHTTLIALGVDTQSAEFSGLEARLGSIADFERGLPERTTSVGSSFRIERSNPPSGSSGHGWLVSDGARAGKLTIPLDFSGATEIRFVVGGAADAGHRVELWASGQRLRSVSPRDDASSRRVSWVVEGITGAELVVVDEVASSRKAFWIDGVHARGAGDIREYLRRPPTGEQPAEQVLLAAEEVLPRDDAELLAYIDAHVNITTATLTRLIAGRTETVQ